MTFTALAYATSTGCHGFATVLNVQTFFRTNVIVRPSWRSTLFRASGLERRGWQLIREILDHCTASPLRSARSRCPQGTAGDAVCAGGSGGETETGNAGPDCDASRGDHAEFAQEFSDRTGDHRAAAIVGSILAHRKLSELATILDELEAVAYTGRTVITELSR